MSADNIIIEAKNVQKHFKEGDIHALDGVSLDIHKGEVVVVIGPSGSGKSTFLRCLNLLEVPTGGQILFEGTDITNKKTDINVHRQKMGMVFQHFNLFPHMTILKNMTLAPMKLLKKPQAEAEAQARALLKRVGLEDRANAYPSRLSGGQKQRIAIAGVIAMEPAGADEKPGAYALRRAHLRFGSGDGGGGSGSYEGACQRRDDHGGGHP